MAGEALGPVLDSFEFEATAAVTVNAINLDGEYYAVAYRRSAASAHIKTYRIIPDGTISEIDTWEYTTDDSNYISIHHITSDLYVITATVNDGVTSLGRVKTVHISDTGIITKSIDDSADLVILEYACWVFPIAGNYFAIIAGNSPYNHYIYTFTIVSGAGGITLIDSYLYSDIGYHVRAAGRVSNNVFFAVFGCDSQYKIYTLHVSNVGVITTPYVALQAFAVVCGHGYLNLCQISTNIFAVSGYLALPYPAFIHTVQVNNDGTIEAATIDTLTFTGVKSVDGFICYTGSSSRFFIAYRGADDDGFIDIIDITDAGAISDDPGYAAFEFDAVYGSMPVVLPANGAWLPIFYIGPDGDGFLASITFTAPAEGAHHEMIMKIGP